MMLEHDGVPKQALVIKTGDLNQPFQKLTEKQALLDQYGHTSITLSSANTHSYEKLNIEFPEYLTAMLQPRTLEDVAGKTWYMFGNNNYSDWTNFTEHYVRPPYPYDRDPFYSFGIGGSGSGVPFHTHGAVFSEVLHGYKRWFVSPVTAKPVFSPDETSYYWFKQVYPGITQVSLQECTLMPNEALWIPSQWWHATLNIGDAVFVSTFV